MKFTISGTLLRYTEYEKHPVCEAATVESALQELVTKYPELKNLLFDRLGNVRVTHRLFLNGEALSGDGFLQRQLTAEDTIEILTAVAGG